MKKLPYNSRFWILAVGFVVSIFVPGIVQVSIESSQLQSIRIQQIYSFIALAMLYLAVLIAPFYKAFKSFPFENQIKHARRAFGVLAFYFAFLHAYIAFFGQLGGVDGLSFLENRYGPSLLLGLVGLIILAAMAFTSTDWAIKKMQFKNWKILHRFVYLAAIAIFVHVIIIGTHYNNDSQLAARITFVGLLFLLGLEAWRFDSYIKNRFTKLGNIGIASMLVVHALFLGLGFVIGTKNDSKAQVTDSPHDYHGIQSGDESVSRKESNGYTVSLDQANFSIQDIVTGQEPIILNVSPLVNSMQTPECFLVDHDDLSYVKGYTKMSTTDTESLVACLPLGDTTPPRPGDYELYLRLNTGSGIITVNFPIRIT